MAQRTPNYTLVIIILLVSTAITFWAHSRPALSLPSSSLSSLPKTIGDWKQDGSDSSVGKDVLDGWIVTSNEMLLRDYKKSDGGCISLMAVYKGFDRRGWHLSEMCYSGSGYNVKQSITQVPYAGRNVSAVKLVAENTQDSSKTISVYWFAQGEHTESNFLKQQALMALSRLNPPHDGWAFIRVTSSVTESEEESMRRICDFTKTASDSLIKCLAPSTKSL